MSFILDALKKSESDRQRQTGPALFEVKVAPPRTRLPPWAIAIALLLVVNLGIVMWLLMRHPLRAGPTDAAAMTSAASGDAGTGAGAARPASSPQPAQDPPATARPSVSASAPALSSTAPPSSAGSAPPAPRGAASSMPATPGPAGGGAITAGGAASPVDAANPDDYAPAEETPAPAAGGPFNGRVRRGTASGVPLYQDAAATPGTQIPQLRLDLHVFAVRPQDRFVMINMHKLHEGDTTPEGAHVENITPEGAVLSYNGARFLLPRE